MFLDCEWLHHPGKKIKNKSNYLSISPACDSYWWWPSIALVIRVGAVAVPADIVQILSLHLPSRARSQTCFPTHTVSFQLNNYTNNSCSPCTVPGFVLLAFSYRLCSLSPLPDCDSYDDCGSPAVNWLMLSGFYLVVVVVHSLRNWLCGCGFDGCTNDCGGLCISYYFMVALH